MGRIRFYSEDGSIYITVRADELDPGNKFTFAVKTRKRRMPLQPNKKLRAKPLTASQTAELNENTWPKIIAALEDIQAGIEDGTYSRVMFGTVFKSDELQLSIELGKGKWKNFEADNYLQALLDYFDAALLVITPTPPSPPERGARVKE